MKTKFVQQESIFYVFLLLKFINHDEKIKYEKSKTYSVCFCVKGEDEILPSPRLVAVSLKNGRWKAI